VFTKGAPEKLVQLCLKESVPNNFHEILHNYAKDGLRVLAFATKVLSH